MLVLSRKQNERILIGDDIVVEVIRIGPNKVRLGIQAPKHVEIVRDELLTRNLDYYSCGIDDLNADQPGPGNP